MDRVSDLIMQEIANLILKGDLKDPRIGFVTITEVHLSKDLKRAKVYFSQIGTDEEIKMSAEGLNSGAGFVKRHLRKHLTMKRIPDVTFLYDSSLAYSSKMNKMIREAVHSDEGSDSDNSGNDDN